MKKLIGFVSVSALIASFVLVGCGTPDSGLCSEGCADPATKPLNDAGSDTAPTVCTELMLGACTTGAVSQTCVGKSYQQDWTCCSGNWSAGKTCSAPADAGTACGYTAGAACPSLGLVACSGTLACCANGSGGSTWVAGSSCGSPAPVDSGTPAPAADPLPAGGDGAAATVTITVSAPALGGVAADHVWVESGFTSHGDMRAAPKAQWLPGTSWSALGASYGCDIVTGTGFVCKFPKPAGYDVRYQVYVQRGSSVYYLCNQVSSTFDPGGSTQVASGIPSSKQLFTYNVKGAPYVDCDYGS